MTKRVMETVIFRLNEGVSREDFTQAAQKMTGWILTQPGFVARRLSVAEDGTWVEQVEWASMADARLAAAGIGKAPGNASFLSCINGSSVQICHSELAVAVN